MGRQDVRAKAVLAAGDEQRDTWPGMSTRLSTDATVCAS